MFIPLLALAVLAGGPSSTIAGPSRQPNVLIIVTDDQRSGGFLRVMPETRRWFQRRGTEFTSAFATTPLCCPSRSTIMTGRFAHNTGVRNNFETPNLDQNTTMQAYLGRSGYLTSLVGKFLNEWPVDVNPPFFDRWARLPGGYWDERFNIDGTVRTVPGYTTDFLADRAVDDLEWFEESDARPWLMYITPYAPHPWPEPAARHADAWVPRWVPPPSTEETDLSDKPSFVQSSGATPDRARRLRRRQLRTLMAVDDLVGRVMTRLRQLGESRRTIAFFLSDNGVFWAEHGLAGKGMPYSEAVKVPFFLRWPDRVPEGAVVDRLVGTVDIAPTVLEAAGVSDLVAPLDGRSLLREQGRERMLLEHWVNPDQWGGHIPDWASIRTAADQYVEYYDDSGDVTFQEYYDLVADPYQLHNLLADGVPVNDPPAAQITALSELLSADRGCAGTVTSTPCP